MQATDLSIPGATSAGSFQLPSAVTIETVEALLLELKQLAFVPPVFTLDASQTEVLTTPGIQLLLSLVKTLETSGVAFALSNLRPAFSQTIAQLGLTSHFAPWEISND